MKRINKLLATLPTHDRRRIVQTVYASLIGAPGLTDEQRARLEQWRARALREGRRAA